MKLFATDYDGTLNIDHHITESAKTAIRKWREAGNPFAIVSGRSMESLKEEVITQQIEADFYVGNNGGVIYDASFQEIKTYYFPYQKAMDILTYLKQAHIISYVINDGYYRAREIIDSSYPDEKYGHTSITYPPAELMANKHIAQIVAVPVSQQDNEKIAAYINTNFADVANAYRNIHCVDITPHGISKATGIAYLLHHLHLTKQDTYAIGDSYNDIPMLTTYYGFAVAHANDTVKQSANETCPDIAAALTKALNHPNLS